MSDRSHISVILDRTGSMQDIRDDVVGGFNAFLAAIMCWQSARFLTSIFFIKCACWTSR